MNKNTLEETARLLLTPPKGILAADESTGSIEKRFASVGVESTSESRRVYRQLLFTSPGIEKFISGVIMFDETARQSADDGTTFIKILSHKGIIPGIKVDKGAKDMAGFPGEKITEGLDGLRERFSEYAEMGLRFAKWRAVIEVGDEIPTDECIHFNSELLARYAALAQEANIVPIVEPEVLMEGKHSISRSKQVLRKVLKEVFLSLDRNKIFLKGTILKSSWVHPGLESGEQAESKAIARETIDVFKEVLPDDLPGIVFLSGGDSPEDSTSHLDALNELFHEPWLFSFSFGRALQQTVLETWKGNKENVARAQQVFYERAELNSLATKGKY